MVRPGSAWRMHPNLPEHVLKRIDLLAPELTQNPAGQALASRLEVVDGARPNVTVLVQLLRSLQAEHQAISEPPEDLLRAARWAMRQMADALPGEEKAAVEGVALLATTAGTSRFVPDPFVAKDALLRETWERALPMLDADHAIHRDNPFGLRVLDELVVAETQIDQVDPDTSKRIKGWVEHTKPLLAALVKVEVPSRDDRVIARLHHLEVEPCTDLRIDYRFGTDTITRPEAVSYITERMSSEGHRRVIGTAFLEVSEESQTCDWYDFGPRLARFLDVPNLADAFSILLASEPQEQKRFLGARRVTSEDIETATARLRIDTPWTLDERFQVDFLATSSLVRAADIWTGSSGARDLTGAHIPQGMSEPPDPDESRPDPEVEHQELELPEVDLDAVRFTEAVTARIKDADDGPYSGGSYSEPGESMTVAQIEHQRRNQKLYGKRGEKVVVDWLRTQLRPEDVTWEAANRELAPFDIKVNDNGVVRYIEVKSTIGDNPYEAFDISRNELNFALANASSYEIYRVTKVDTAAPLITRLVDPIEDLKRGHASLHFTSARLRVNPGVRE